MEIPPFIVNVPVSVPVPLPSSVQEPDPDALKPPKLSVRVNVPPCPSLRAQTKVPFADIVPLELPDVEVAFSVQLSSKANVTFAVSEYMKVPPVLENPPV